MKKIASGRRGDIFIDRVDGVAIATKRAKGLEHCGAIQKEGKILAILKQQHLSFVPQLIEATDNQFTYEWIKGVHFRDVRKTSNDKKRKRLATQLLNHAFALDKVGITHGELMRPYTNVLYNDKTGKLSIIDFERGSLTDKKPKNIRHVAQWLHTKGYITPNQLQTLGTIASVEESYTFVFNQIPQQMETANPKPMHSQLYTMLLLILGDQITKYIFFNKRFLEEQVLITPVLNTGIGWSIPMPIITTICISLVLLIALYFLINKTRRIEVVGYLLLCAGALGNIIDRVVYHGVRDFIDLQYWPVFNLADILISIGIGCFIIGFFASCKPQEKKMS